MKQIIAIIIILADVSLYGDPSVLHVKYVGLADRDAKFNAQFESGSCKNEDILVNKNNASGVYRNHEGCDITVVKGFVKNAQGQWIEVAQFGPLYRSTGSHTVQLLNKGMGGFEIVGSISYQP